MDHYEKTGVADSYHSIFENEAEDPEKIRKAIQRFTNFIKYVPENGQILDAGCGTGRYTRYFLNRGFSVTGIDTSDAMLTIAKRENPGTHFLRMDMRSLGFRSDFFDGIWNVASILHLGKDDVLLALKESNRVLKSGAVLFIATRTNDTDTIMQEEMTEGGRATVNYYSLPTLRKMLIESGFVVLEATIEPDDHNRPFNYCYIYARSVKF